MCGKKITDIYVVDIGGVELGVCSSCARGKKLVRTNAKRVEGRKPVIRRSVPKEEAEIIEGYGEAIKKAREKLNVPLPVMAEMLNEKESHLRRVEQQKTLPSAELTKKLEKFLNIKLTAEGGDETGFTAKPSAGKASLGEFINRGS